MKYPFVSLFGVHVSKMNMEETVAYLVNEVENNRVNQIVTANPIMLMTGLRDAEFMQAMRSSELVVPDGTGLVWAASYVGEPVAERVAGFDLLLELMKVASERKWKVFLLGAAPDVVEETARIFRKQYPGAELVGIRDGFFKAEQDKEIVEQIIEADPHLLFVARSVDTQEPWIAKYKEKLQVPIMMGVGGSFDVISGKVKRAPLFIQKLRLEWFHRLVLQPSRWRRMLDLPRFVLKVRANKEKVTNWE